LLLLSASKEGDAYKEENNGGIKISRRSIHSFNGIVFPFLFYTQAFYTSTQIRQCECALGLRMVSSMPLLDSCCFIYYTNVVKYRQADAVITL